MSNCPACVALHEDGSVIRMSLWRGLLHRDGSVISAVTIQVSAATATAVQDVGRYSLGTFVAHGMQ